MSQIQDQVIATLLNLYEAKLKKHQLNVEVMLENPTGIHDHSDFVGAIELELQQMANYHDYIEVIRNYLV